MTTTRNGWSVAALVVGMALVYWQVFAKLVHDWYNDDNYSHGFLIIPLALYFAWERRQKLAYARLGEDAKARKALQYALKLAPGFEGATEAKQVLASLVY